jgi:hypothetical protein
LSDFRCLSQGCVCLLGSGVHLLGSSIRFFEAR